MSVQRSVAESSDGVARTGNDEPDSTLRETSRGKPLWEPQGELSRLFTLAESPQAFWDEMKATLDEFSDIVRASRDRIVQLSADLAQRDNAIAILKAKNLALEAQLAIVGATQAVPVVATPPLGDTPHVTPSPDAAKDGGIWRRLTRLERE